VPRLVNKTFSRGTSC